MDNKYIKFLRKFGLLKSIINYIDTRVVYLKNYKYIRNNKRYVNKYEGKRCFIVANGPSLSRMDLSLIKDEHTFGVNNLMATDKYNILKPTFYTIIDSNFFNDDYAVLSDNLKSLKDKKHKPICIFPARKREYIQKHKLDEHLDIIWVAYNTKKDKRIKKDFSLTGLIPYCLNVANVALYVAISMGFKEIYLLGTDMTGVLHTYDENWEFKDAGHFFKSDEKLSRYEEKKFEVRKNEEMLKVYAGVFQIFRQAYDYANKHGIKIVNLTPTGALDIFPLGKYEDVVKSNS